LILSDHKTDVFHNFRSPTKEKSMLGRFRNVTNNLKKRD